MDLFRLEYRVRRCRSGDRQRNRVGDDYGSICKYSGNRNSQSNEYSAVPGLPSGNAGYGLNCRRGDPAICCNGNLFRRKHPRPDRLGAVEFVRLEHRISQRSRLGHGRGSRCGYRDGSIWRYAGNCHSQRHQRRRKFDRNYPLPGGSLNPCQHQPAIHGHRQLQRRKQSRSYRPGQLEFILHLDGID
jgi:hypothetical protein